MENRELKFSDQDIIPYLIKNSIHTQAKLNALSEMFLTHVVLTSPDKLTWYDKMFHEKTEKHFQQLLQELEMLDVNLSDSLNKFLNDLNT